ncbi:hypothetical protein CR513_29644, partial [Mucuna pruriens]
MALSEYDIVYMSQKAIKGSALAEHLTHHSISNYQPFQHEFHDKYIVVVAKIESQSNEWMMWFGGATNLLGNGIGAVLASPKINASRSRQEYKACALGIMMALEHQVKKLKVCGDSALVIYQRCGKYSNPLPYPCEGNTQIF